jgi:hypothetical protein
MSDPGAPDPMDKAYVDAEAVLDDAAARAARRARLLGAVASEPVAPQAAPAARRPAWRSARWLAAACVAGLGLLIAIQTYHPADHELRVASAAPAPAPLSAQRIVASPGPPAPSATVAPPPIAAPRAVMSTSPPAFAKAEPPPPPPAFVPVAPPPPPAFVNAPAPQGFPAEAAPPAPPPPSSDVTVEAERRERDGAAADQSEARGAAMQAPAAGFAAQTGAQALAGLSPDAAARLRAAAAAGRTAELDALLAQGVAVDATDAAGETALMKSIQADQPAAAAVLRRHGASLDRKDHAGESARDMATAKGDATLNQAIGLGR